LLSYIAKKIFGTKNQRILKGLRPLVVKINELEPEMRKKSPEDLRNETNKFREEVAQLKAGCQGKPESVQREVERESLERLLPRAFAVCREAGRRVLNMRHFDVQLIGGAILHRGCIAEMKTGEGKTLVATLALYLNALWGDGVHLITVNDYLARRDAEWMGRIYNYLGMSVGVIVHGLTDADRQKHYGRDITYGTNSEFGFDYLRDNMKESIERYVQRDLHYGIVDEVDSILIDEARTPLIISGPAEESAGHYAKVNGIIPTLRKDIDYTVDEKAHSAILTDSGVDRVEHKLSVGNLYNPQNIAWLHHVTQALRAHALYKRDVNYLVDGGEIIIVDEFTGRKMPGRRWSDGLHQAVEAKEGVQIQEENQTLATISYQNYFRIYKKLAGMTGTADTEAEEFAKIYKLEVTVIPPHKPMIRQDHHDVVYKNERGKFRAVLKEIEDCHQRGQPVLVGTVSVEKSQVVASLLEKKRIPHNVLNAKQHEREASVVAQAGRKGKVTISTNMAGRGTDIILGGNPEFMAREKVDPEAAGQPGAKVDAAKFDVAYAEFKTQCDAERQEVLAAGGLHILGTERHESRRIDNQLRGRAGRQGDPGSSRFFLSLEDDLMRIFGAERISGLMERLGMEEDVPIEHPIINRAIENAQKKVEGNNFDIRKSLLEYDDVMNQQRKTIYALRRQVLEGVYAPLLSEAEQKEGKSEPEQKASRKPPAPASSGLPTADTLTSEGAQNVGKAGAEQKASKKPPGPASSGPHTLKTLSEMVRPDLAKMVNALTDRQAPTSADGTTAVAGGTAVPFEPAKFRSEVYRWFGTYPEVTGILEDRVGTLNKLADHVAWSLLQQRERFLDLSEEVLQELLDQTCPENAHAEDWDLKALASGMKERFDFEPTIKSEGLLERERLAEMTWAQVEKIVEARENQLEGPHKFLYYFRYFMLEEIDQRWIEHLKNMEALREGIGLRGYGQKDPKQEYKKEGFVIFGEMMASISRNLCQKLFQVQIRREESEAAAQQMADKQAKRRPRATIESGGGPAQAAGAQVSSEPQPVRRTQPKVGRNDACPCGSGKKYKKCHGVTV
jgi:preprotein translocase subunit SecA